ncbi:MAG TPA: sigma 54-interacting transcriptional regulator [Symbiobacteriaceae bacterium]|nr:sigma 54-interacting transcriptional regulator [Symbiobacteriaceae bacterium]
MEITQLMQAAAPLLEALHDGVAVCDADGIVVYVNEANARITGMVARNVLERPVREVAPDSHLLQVLESRRPLVGVRTRVAGREVISNIVPLQEGGRLIGAVSVFRDVTEVMALNAQLAEAHNTIALLRGYLSTGDELDGVVIGRSPVAQRAFNLALRAAAVGSPVLIEGESGTGKEVVARLIHAHSDRKGRPFIAMNCAAVPATLLESELFGYDEGAFTGARRGGRAGLFEMADGGTLFLDEIGDMELAMQAKLLRALQGGEFRRLGGGAVRKSDVRIISATNRPLQGLVEAKQFREDLYYRLRVIRILLPPLRERREDLPTFIEHGLRRAGERLGRAPAALDQAALRLLLAYQYPGNVRELENLLEQAMVLDDDGVITESDLPPEVAPRDAGATVGLLAETAGFPGWDEVEKALLEAGLRHFSSKAALAEHLGMGRATLYRKLAKHGLQ